MRFGVCTGLEDVGKVLDAGFEYVEVGASGFNGMSEDWDPSPYQGLPIGATNLFFDHRIRLFGQNQTPYHAYAERTVSRAATLGIPVMVIGSGGPRNAPDGIDGDAGFVTIVAEIEEIARPHGIHIAPESLNRSETNVGNDLRRLALDLHKRGVGYTADSYHVLYEWDANGRVQDLEQVWKEQVPFAPTHVHVANLPRAGVDADDPMLQGFARRLRHLAYDKSVSLECSRGEGFDYVKALATLESLFDRDRK
jgi:sugar phosphate isomerase/epimerase